MVVLRIIVLKLYTIGAECDCGHSDTCMSQNSAAQVEDDDDLAFTLNHQTVNCFDNGYYGYCDASGDKGCTVVCRPPEARQIKHVISHTGEQELIIKEFHLVNWYI